MVFKPARLTGLCYPAKYYTHRTSLIAFLNHTRRPKFLKMGPFLEDHRWSEPMAYAMVSEVRGIIPSPIWNHLPHRNPARRNKAIDTDSRKCILTCKTRRKTKSVPTRTRTWNLMLRRHTPYPLGHRYSTCVIIILFLKCDRWGGR